jgi:DNA-binding MarR family transcriptional regulator
MRDLSSEKYYVPILKYLLEHGVVKKYDLREIVKSSGTMDKLLPKFEAEGLISIKEEMLGRRTFFVSLTPKGRAVAQQLKKAEEVSEGKSDLITLNQSDYNEFVSHTRDMSVLAQLNVLDDHVAIHEVNYDSQGHDRVVFVYIKLNGNGILRLWCEIDNSFSCWHVKYAWTIPDVQAMVQYQMRKGNVKKVD